MFCVCLERGSHPLGHYTGSCLLRPIALLLCLTSVLTQQLYVSVEDPEASLVHDGTPWTYDQLGDDWNGSDAAGKPWVCLTGQQQSPVNLPVTSDAVTLVDATQRTMFNLGSMTSNGSNIRVKNNGHSVEVAWSDASFAPKVTISVQEDKPLKSNIQLVYGNRMSTVTAVPKQFHFHTHSEHLIGGKLYPLEAHLVSTVSQTDMPSCPAAGCIVVTAVLFELADDLTTDNPWLRTFFDVMPLMEDEEAYVPSSTVLDLGSLLPSNTSYLSYSGSLTTPPCTEEVLWVVMINPQKISLQQWRAFQKAVGDYNCTVTPAAAAVGDRQKSASNTSSGAPSSADDEPVVKNATRHLAALLDSIGHTGTAFRLPYVGLKRQSLAATQTATAEQQYKCDKLGLGINARLPQNLNGRSVRLWRETSSKKSYLPGDATAAASAGAIAGIVLGATLGAGLTSLIGYVAYRQYQKRRIRRLYAMGISTNDMMMVQQEVEQQWLTAGTATGNSIQPPAARLSRSGDIV